MRTTATRCRSLGGMLHTCPGLPACLRKLLVTSWGETPGSNPRTTGRKCGGGVHIEKQGCAAGGRGGRRGGRQGSRPGPAARSRGARRCARAPIRLVVLGSGLSVKRLPLGAQAHSPRRRPGGAAESAAREQPQWRLRGAGAPARARGEAARLRARSERGVLARFGVLATAQGIALGSHGNETGLCKGGGQLGQSSSGAGGEGPKKQPWPPVVDATGAEGGRSVICGAPRLRGRVSVAKAAAAARARRCRCCGASRRCSTPRVHAVGLRARAAIVGCGAGANWGGGHEHTKLKNAALSVRVAPRPTGGGRPCGRCGALGVRPRFACASCGSQARPQAPSQEQAGVPCALPEQHA